VLLLVALPIAVRGQDGDMLPLRFARASTALQSRFHSDWEVLSPGRQEWAYCISKWSVSITSDSDSVYVAEEVTRLRPVKAEQAGLALDSGSCTTGAGVPLPIAHSHPSGNCSPSRLDITAAIVRKQAPFQLIICGPNSIAGYSGQLYVDVMKYNAGRLFSRK
jgi:proteasome lid subunit RPN8/RPN11